jgi:hypothetical protein
MRIVYIDPGLSVRKGHNAAMAEELDDALVTERGNQVTYLIGASANPLDFAHLRGKVLPAFRIDGYARPGVEDLQDSSRLARILNLIAADLDATRALDDCDAVLMPTAYPLHIRALSLRAEHLRGRRVVVGLLLPARFWSPDEERVASIADLFGQGLHALADCTQLFLYNETGSFSLRDSVLSIPRLLPPLGTRNADLVRQLAQRTLPSASELQPSIGFFGSPFTSKGFGLLVSAAKRLVAAGESPNIRLVVRLPQGYEPACAELAAIAPWVDARSSRTSNEAYLSEMSSVDVVWALYDPIEYGDKMSGIVPEALSLGKPLLVTEGCSGIEEFIEWQAPGSHVCGPYDERTVANVLKLPANVWVRPAICARNHAPLIAELKSMPRYLAVCGLGEAPGSGRAKHPKT